MKFFIYLTHGLPVDAKMFRHQVARYHKDAMVLTAVHAENKWVICHNSRVNIPDGLGLVEQVNYLKEKCKFARQDIFLYVDANLTDICGATITPDVLLYVEQIVPMVVIFFTATLVCRQFTDSWITQHGYPRHPDLYQLQGTATIEQQLLPRKLDLLQPPIFGILDKKGSMSSLATVANIQDLPPVNKHIWSLQALFGEPKPVNHTEPVTPEYQYHA